MSLTLPHARRKLFVRAALLVGTLGFGFLHACQIWRGASEGVPWDVRLQARWVGRAIADDNHAWQHPLFPEGELFESEFYGLALANIADTTHDPDDVARAVSGLRELLPKLEPMVHHAPLKVMAHAELRGGIMWFGGQNILRARLMRLASDRTREEEARFHADSALLARLYGRSQAGLLDSFPGKTWPVDNLFAYRSLQIHDELYGTHYGDLFAKLHDALVRTQDRQTGLAPSFLALDGHAHELPRGCALSWSLAVLRELDPAYADAQWAAYRKHFIRCAFGLCLVREYPPGRDRGMDLDSGPMVDGLGMAASGFALAAAREEGDLETADALTRTGEMLGFPSISWWGKRYWGGEVVFLDVLALWTKTIPLPPSTTTSHTTGWIALPVLLGWTLLALVQLPFVLRARRALREASGPSTVQRALELATYLLLALHLCWPGMRALTLVLGWTAFGLASGFFALLARGRKQPVASAACVEPPSPSS
ncbi:MAG: hypothetical protein JST54_15040 [Deltaproteobacteria bacterium]|nr:hypothetical protein [Deltaproteobacteria bacterium]